MIAIALRLSWGEALAADQYLIGVVALLPGQV
jgi:hypothetical protein